MQQSALSPAESSRARRRFYLFTVFNITSFALMGNNIITLYVLRLEASTLLVGVLSSFVYLAYFGMLLGRMLVPKLGIVKTMGRYWMFRYLAMIPMLGSAYLATRGFRDFSMALVVLGVLGFNFFRGIAVTGYNPIVGEIVNQKERGAFLARIQIIVHVMNLLISVLIALVLARYSSLMIYTMFIALGILAGLTAGMVILRLPEPVALERSVATKFWNNLTQAFRRKNFRRFMLVYFLIITCFYMVQPFLVVFVKQIYLRPDSQALLLSLAGSVGAVVMALISGFMIDRLGAKPLFFLFSGVLTITMVLLVLVPAAPPLTMMLTGAAVLFFLHGLGGTGILNSAQTYFLAAIHREERLNLGVVFFLAQGLAGGIGSIFGGMILQSLQSLSSVSPAGAFRLYFAAITMGLIVLLFFINSISSLGAYGIRDALSVFVSPRDLRAISLLHRLGKSRSSAEERRMIRRLGDSHSALSIRELLIRLKSPRFSIRTESLFALANLPVNEQVIQALVTEVKNHAFTTAYQAADILGKKQIRQGIPILRKMMDSKDFFLSGTCMVSLSRMKDMRSLPHIERMLSRSTNPRLIIHAAWALAIFRDTGSLDVLLKKLKQKTFPYIRDELILSMAGILGMSLWFYPLYDAFLEQSSLGVSMLRDVVDSCTHPDLPADQLLNLIAKLNLRNRQFFCKQAGEMLRTLDGRAAEAEALIKALQESGLRQLPRLSFLITAFILYSTCDAEKPAAP